MRTPCCLRIVLAQLLWTQLVRGRPPSLSLP